MKSFGRDYLIPGPLEPNLIIEIASAVAKAAMDSGVATLPIEDMKAYRQRLSEFVYNSAFVMKPIFARAKSAPKRIVYCEGEDNNILLAVQVVVDEGLAQPILVGRPAVINDHINKLGLRLKMAKTSRSSTKMMILATKTTGRATTRKQAPRREYRACSS